MDNIKAQIDKTIKAFQIDHYGWAPLEKPLTFHFYEQWINNSFHGEMKYLEEHLPFKESPSRLADKARSAIVIAQPYYDQVPGELPLKQLKVASYARGEDYHHWFKNKLIQLANELKAAFPEEEFLCFTDSSPILERDLAQRSGIGWFGKNTCIIDSKKGSLFFIGEIYTSLELSEWDLIHPDRCGTCTKCIDACPTSAIVEPYKLDARKCISYHTIESKDLSPNPLHKSFSHWFFGCDICQTVCPWNKKNLGSETMDGENIITSELTELEKEIKLILTSSNKQLQRLFAGTALSRAGGNGLKRNALVVAANLNLISLLPLIASLKDHPRLGSMAQWCLSQIEAN